MRILIVSDTHRKNGNLSEVLRRLGSLDCLVHCGDIEGGEDFIREEAGCPAYMVAGNNDFFTGLPREQQFMLGGYKVWLTHGHAQFVSMGYGPIREEARAMGVQIVMCGHTHRPLVDVARTPDGVTLLNPGSISYPRQEGRRPSFILMEIDEKGKAHYHLRFL